MATPLRPAAPAHPAPLVRAPRLPDPAQLRSVGGSRRRGPLPRVVRRAPPPRAAPRRGGRAGRPRRPRRPGRRHLRRPLGRPPRRRQHDRGATTSSSPRATTTPPWRPTGPASDAFTGEVVLARDYRNGRPFAGRDVLVVGSGNTGMEIATDLADHGATRVWLAVRTPPHILPRSRLGWPAQGTGILVRRLPPRLVDRVAAVLAVVQEPDLTGVRPAQARHRPVLARARRAGSRCRTSASSTRSAPGGSSRWRPSRRSRARDVVLADGSRVRAVRRRRRHRLPGRPRAARRPPRGARRPRPAPGARPARARRRRGPVVHGVHQPHLGDAARAADRRGADRGGGQPGRRSVSSVKRCARSRSTSGAPSAVAGVSTPAASGSASPSSTRLSAAWPSMYAVPR